MFSLCVISWETPLKLRLGNLLQFWPESPSIILASGPFSGYSLGLLSNCSGELRVPFELQQVIRGSFRVVVELPRELQWADPLQ